jgi:hypothetical protein
MFTLCERFSLFSRRIFILRKKRSESRIIPYSTRIPTFEQKSDAAHFRHIVAVVHGFGNEYFIAEDALCPA